MPLLESGLLKMQETRLFNAACEYAATVAHGEDARTAERTLIDAARNYVEAERLMGVIEKNCEDDGT